MTPEIKASLWSAGLYFVVANPLTYGIMQSLLGSIVSITDANGAPTQIGTAIHAIVFGLLVYLIMRLTQKARDKALTSESYTFTQ